MAKAPISSLYAITAKHLGPGSVCPPVTSGVIRCYTNKYCPFAQRVHLVLAAKQVNHEFVLVNLKAKPKWLFEKNPYGKLPVLEHDGRILYESLVICDYLDEAYPNTSLYPADPWYKAHDRLLAHQWSKGSFALHKIMFSNGDIELVAAAVTELQNTVDIFQKELQQRCTTFFGGDTPGMLDYMVWPWAERFQLASHVVGGDELLPEVRFKTWMMWTSAMMKNPVVLATYLQPEEHAKFYNSFEGNRLNMKSAL